MREIQYRHDSDHLPPSLEKVPFLHGLQQSVMEKLMGDAVLLECEPGDSLIVEGDVTDFFCILLNGEMDILKGGKKVARVKGSGEIIGELALVSNFKRSASVVAATHSYCLKIEPESLRDLDEVERNSFYVKLYQFSSRLIAQRLERAEKRIAQLEAKVRELSGISAKDGEEDKPAVYRL